MDSLEPSENVWILLANLWWMLGRSAIAKTKMKAMKRQTQAEKDFPGLLNNWLLEGADGDVVLKGTPSPRYEVAAGKKALYLPGSKGYAEVPAVQMNPEGYTFMLWLKPVNLSISGADIQHIYSDWSVPERFSLVLARGFQALFFRLMKPDGNVMDVAYAFIDMNGWNHLAVTWNKAVGKVRMTVNGTEQINKESVPILPTAHTTYHLGILGIYTPSVVRDNAFHGHLRDLMVFNNSMTDQEIKAAMNYRPKGSVWIGLNALNDTTIFKWSDGTTTKNMALSYFPGAPSDWPKCVAVHWKGKWVDDFCMQPKSFVCRKPFP